MTLVGDADLGALVLRNASREVVKHLELSNGWRRLLGAEGQTHPGDDPIEVDAEAHRVFEQGLADHLGYYSLSLSEVIGEENLKEARELERLRRTMAEGERLVILDPLDGSSQWALMRAGYCVAAMLLVKHSGAFELESACVSTPVHTFTWIGGRLRFGRTFGRPSEDVILTSCQPDRDLHEPSVALTGYKTKDRKSVLALMQGLPRWDILTLGGNPATPYVVAGNLSAAMTVRPQYVWDAVGVLMCSATDAIVGTLDGDVLDAPTCLALFNRVSMSQDAPSIPPLIVAKTDQLYEELRAAVVAARDSTGEWFGSGMEDLGL